MGDWKRSTRECPVEDLEPNLQKAIRAHIELYNLGDILPDALMCIETKSQKIKKSVLGGGDNSVLVAAVLTPRWLVWAIRGDRPDVAVMSARLEEVTIQDYAATKFGTMVPDTGLEVSDSFTDVPDRGSAFIGLSGDTTGEKFRQLALDAVQKAKR